MTQFSKLLKKTAFLDYPQSNFGCMGMVQQGQALAEGLLVLLSLLLAWAAITWLGRMQDVSLQAAHASRYVAFAATRGFEAQAEKQTLTHYFSGPAHQWQDKSGKLLLKPGSQQVSMVSQRLSSLAASAQPGGSGPAVSDLRTEFHTADNGILRVSSVVDVTGLPPAESTAITDITKWWPVLRRETSILTGAGHASDDSQVQQRLASAPTAWQDSSRVSYRLASKTDAAMKAVDGAWGRPSPTSEWLDVWTASLPSHHVYP